jgi:hypothetical protein
MNSEKILSRCHSARHKSHRTDIGANSGHRSGNPAIKRLRYVALRSTHSQQEYILTLASRPPATAPRYHDNLQTQHCTGGGGGGPTAPQQAAASKPVTVVTLTITGETKSIAVLTPPCRRQEGKEVQLTLILDVSARWSEWSASRPGRVLPPVPTVQEAGWASSGLVIVARGKILCLCRALNPGRPVCSQTLY